MDDNKLNCCNWNCSLNLNEKLRLCREEVDLEGQLCVNCGDFYTSHVCHAANDHKYR